jgi:hypothetical protein
LLFFFAEVLSSPLLPLLTLCSFALMVSGTKVIGSSFYTVDPTTGIGTDLGSIQHKDESDPKYYGGYHRSVDIEGKKAYRLGYKKVSDQTNPGLGIVHLDDQTAEWANVQTPSDNMHNW